MTRLLASALLGIASVVVADTLLPGQEPKPPEKQPAKKKGKSAVPKSYPPDDATLRTIVEKTDRLRAAVRALEQKKVPADVLAEVAVYLKAAENIVRFEEWLHASSVKWALTTLDRGLERAKQAEGGRPVWRDAPGQWVVRAYRSRIDDSIQPYAVLLPPDFGKDPGKTWRLDIVLHGRDASLTEAKFIATHAGAAPKDRDFIQLEVYGRGNNAYRWAGETDVFEAWDDFTRTTPGVVDPHRVVLRGFSMGGAGTWHIGLHHPCRFAVLGPGAGFTTTHGYVGGLPAELPEYQEKCLRIYDAVRYAENAFNVPVVAYSGEKDAQKKAADTIENALKDFPDPLRFTHLVAPGLEHAMPPEWQAKAEAEYRKYAGPGRDPDTRRVRFVTYTPRYGNCDWIGIRALERTYEKALVDGTRKGTTFDVRTKNVRRLLLVGDPEQKLAPTVTVDGQKVEVGAESPVLVLDKVGGTWRSLGLLSKEAREFPGIKESGRQGPIDDAFRDRFVVVAPPAASDTGWPAAARAEFAALWDRYFRGPLPVIPESAYQPRSSGNLVLFGTPSTNPLIAKLLPRLPITWTDDKLVVNGTEYEAKTHLPVLVYPNPLAPANYVVINSGHTFKEADLRGTNALLFPKLGDWAVIKPVPTANNPAAFEVVAAGLFDDDWQFPKK